MADEISMQFEVQGPPNYVMGDWRTLAPVLPEHGFELVDESFNSLTFERRYLDWPQKILMITTIIGFLFRSWLTSVFRVTARFDEAGTNTRVTIAGTAQPKAAAALRELVAEHGGMLQTPTVSASSTLLPGSPSS